MHTLVKCELPIPIWSVAWPNPPQILEVLLAICRSVGHSPGHNDLRLTSEDRSRVRTLGKLSTIHTMHLQTMGQGQPSTSEGWSKRLEGSKMQILRLKLPHLPGFWHSRRNAQVATFYLGRKRPGTRSWILPESKGQVVRALCWGRTSLGATPCSV